MLESLTTLSSLIFHSKCLTCVLMEDIADIKCQLHRLHSEEYFIPQKKETVSDIFVIIYVLKINLR